MTGTVVAFGDGETDALVVSLEWLGFYDLTSPTRAMLSRATGVPEDHILLTGTHTHCGPAMRALDARRHGPGTLDQTYLTDIQRKLVDAAVEAMEDRQPVTLSTASTSCGFAASRRKPDGEGGVLWEPSLEAPHDHEVPIVVARNTHGDPKLVLFSYACHPTSTGAILEIGGDYPGFAISEIEEQIPGCTALFVKGCGGDQKPNFEDPVTSGFRKASIDEVRANGRDLANAVLSAVRTPSAKQVDGKLSIRSETVEIVSAPLDLSDVERFSGSTNAMERTWAEHYQGVHEVARDERIVQMEVQSITVGDDLAIVTMAGEMSVEYGLRTKRELRGAFTRVIPLGYANEIVGYVPVERQIPEGGYEVLNNQRALLRTGPFESGTEEAIMRAVHQTVGLA